MAAPLVLFILFLIVIHSEEQSCDNALNCSACVETKFNTAGDYNGSTCVWLVTAYTQKCSLRSQGVETVTAIFQDADKCSHTDSVTITTGKPYFEASTGGFPWSIFAVVVFCVAALISLIWWIWCCYKRRKEENPERNFTAGDVVDIVVDTILPSSLPLS